MNIRLVQVPALCVLCFGLILLVGCKGNEHTSEAQGFEIDDDVSFDENDYEVIVQSNNKLGLDLLETVEPDEQNNRFISPLSLFSALSMAYIGADGETKDEIADTMHMDNTSDEDIKKGHASLYQLLASMPEDITLHHANALWIDNMYSTQDDYSEILDKYYHATFQSDDFSNNATADHINEWIEEQTNGMIQDMVDSPISSDVVLFLLNTLYFQADWTHPFQPELTMDDTFHTDQGDILVPMMTLSESLSYTENSDYQAVVLPYADGEVELNILLPNESSSLDDLMNSMQDMNWKEWRDSLRQQEGNVRLPSFEIEYEATLNSSLQQLGMQQAFQDNAQFPHMIEGEIPLQIGDVVQKSVIVVDEEGTEAASATSISMEETSAPANPPFQMDVNRPFLFTITESNSGTVLFMGTVNDPSPSE